MKVAPQELANDMVEALKLLQCAGPNHLLIEEDEYWQRCTKLLDKYFPDEEEDD